MPGTTAPAAMAVINLRHSMSCSNSFIGIWCNAFLGTFVGIMVCLLLWDSLWDSDLSKHSRIIPWMLFIGSLLLSFTLPVTFIIALFCRFDFSGLN